MARCGCGVFPVCGCTLVGDGSTMSVAGNGQLIAPYRPQVSAYPSPRPHGSVSRSVQTLLTVGTAVVVPWDINESIPTTMWSASQPTRITVPEDGVYLISGGTLPPTSDATGFSATSTGTARFKLELYKNGSTAVFLNAHTNGYKFPALPTQGSNFEIMTIARLVANDFVELVVTATSMVVALTNPALNRPFLDARWMGL